MLRPTATRPVCSGVNHSSGAQDQIFVSQTVASLLMRGALSYERMGLSFTIYGGPRQRWHSRVRVPRDSWPYFTVSDLRLPQLGGPGPLFISPRNRVAQLYPQALGSLSVAPTIRRATVEVFDPASTRGSLQPSSAVNFCWPSPAQSFLGPRQDPWRYICSFQDFDVFWSGASSARREGVWLLPVPPPVRGSDSAHSLHQLVS
jgi:hypothetical protein